MMHWGKTLENKRLGATWRYNGNHTGGGFPYNRTEYELSQEKVLWDKIWIAAYNQSNQQRNRTSPSYANNHFMKKTRLLSDLLNSKTSPHSFVMVMVIASFFLFLTLAMTVAVVIFCRKKNSVFVFQKSEQEDEGDYEMEDMDTNTDLDYGSDNEDEEGSPKKQYGHYLHVYNPTVRPLMNSGVDEEHTSPHPSPIYRPKRPQQDSRGAYQPIKMKGGESSDQGNGSNHSKHTSSLESFTEESPGGKQYFGFFRKLSMKWNRNSEEAVRYNKHIPVIMISKADSNSGYITQSGCKGSTGKDEQTESKHSIIKDITSSPTPSCDTYNTQVSLAHANSTINGENFTNGAVVHLAGITYQTECYADCCDLDEYHNENPSNDTEHDQLIVSSNKPTANTAVTKDFKLSQIWSGCNTGCASLAKCPAPQTDSFISPSLHSLQDSPDKDCTSRVRQNGCHSVPSTPGQSCTPALVLSSTVPSRKQWVTFDDIT